MKLGYVLGGGDNGLFLKTFWMNMAGRNNLLLLEMR